MITRNQQITAPSSAVPFLQNSVRSSLRRAEWTRRLGGEQGQSIVETALILPIFLALFTAIVQLGLALGNEQELVNAVDCGARYLQTIGSTTTDPCADTYNAVTKAAPSLNPSQITLTLTINGSSPVTGNSCPAEASSLTSGTQVTVAVAYPYTVSIAGYSFSGWTGNFTAQSTEYEY